MNDDAVSFAPNTSNPTPPLVPPSSAERPRTDTVAWTPTPRASGAEQPVAVATDEDPLRTVDPAPGDTLTTTGLPRVPGYEILSVLGRGGMGVVYKARQERLNRLVALKMILAGDHTSAEAKVRFLAEAEAIAKVQHPGIVQVYELGTHQGHPYFALEYVEGGSLDKLLAAGPLLPTVAAALVMKLADAVQAAHAQGIVHRDLKPANVLLGGEVVRSCDGQAVSGTTSPPHHLASPKVTDFGLAKQLNTGEGLTATGAVMGTPSYMAPEQALGNASQIGPATDVYALGAILYECLTGRLVFRGATVIDTLDMVRRQEPVPVRQLQPKVPQDVETICHKCLRKEPGQRYASAAALADDLRRFLDGQPIAARPVGRLERMWKWCRRYPTAAALIVVATLAAFLASGLAAWAVNAEHEARSATEAERLAKVEAQTQKQNAEEANAQTKARLIEIEKGIALLGDIFDEIDLSKIQQEGRKLEWVLGERLRKAARDLREEAIADPLTVANLQHVLGVSLYRLGHYADAVPLLEASRMAKARILGPTHADTFACLRVLAAAYLKSGKSDLALPLLEGVLQERKAELGPDHEDTLTSMNDLALSYLEADKPALAVPLLEEALRRYRAIGANESCITSVLNNLALVYDQIGRQEKVLPLLEEVVEIRKRVQGPNHPETLRSVANLAGAYQDNGKPAAAVQLLDNVLPQQKAILGPDNPDTLHSMGILAGSYWRAGQFDRSVPLFEELLPLQAAKFGREHPDTLRTIANLGVNYKDTGRLTEAVPLLEEAYKASRHHPTLRWVGRQLMDAYLKTGKKEQVTVLGKELVAAARAAWPARSSPLMTELSNIATRLLEAHAWAEAEAILHECLVIYEQRGPNALATFGIKAILGHALMGQRKYAEAEPYLLQGYQGMKASQAQLSPRNNRRLVECAENLVQLYEATGKPEEAAKWKKELEAAKAKQPRPAPK
jgi:eukaryotic-like serine/threonine-protein kinase